MDNARLQTQNLAVGYNGKALIRDIALSLRPGEIMTLIGPNGAGKSTILKSVIRQLSLIRGTVCLDGRDMAALTEREVSRSLSVLMTSHIQPELMTCEDVVATGRYPYTGRLGILTREDREKVAQCLKLVHASELADQDFSRVSDGQRQRVLLARALCQEPEVLVLDEPTSFLDIRHKLEL
ncbi:MAG: ABC transporter ATP-binding protein, partial [Oscillospiraceae bacterium]|nr:ABC transporter ATP-binding protein [Oscillospiraceae bacterium]